MAGERLHYYCTSLHILALCFSYIGLWIPYWDHSDSFHTGLYRMCLSGKHCVQGNDDCTVGCFDYDMPPTSLTAVTKAVSINVTLLALTLVVNIILRWRHTFYTAQGIAMAGILNLIACAIYAIITRAELDPYERRNISVGFYFCFAAGCLSIAEAVIYLSEHRAKRQF